MKRVLWYYERSEKTRVNARDHVELRSRTSLTQGTNQVQVRRRQYDFVENLGRGERHRSIA